MSITYGYRPGQDEDLAYTGIYDTMNEAIEAAIATLQPEPGDSLYLCQGVKADPVFLISSCIDADDVINRAAEHASDNYGCDAAADFPDVSIAATKDLDRKLKAVLTLWAKEHNVEAQFYSADEQFRIQVTEELLSGNFEGLKLFRTHSNIVEHGHIVLNMYGMCRTSGKSYMDYTRVANRWVDSGMAYWHTSGLCVDAAFAESFVYDLNKENV